MTTDDGIVGWGDGTLGWKEFAVEAMVKEFAERYLVGKDPFRIEDLWFRLYQVEHNTGPVMYSAMAGLETALWDIVGKACGQPVVNLVGGPMRDRVRAYANGWYGNVNDGKRLREAVQKVTALGYTALKFDPFGAGGREMSRADLRAACQAVETVRDEAGDDVDILIECHGRFSVGTAIEAIKAMQPYAPLFCEEPIPAHNADSQAWVTKAASAMGARIATGEHTYARFGFQELLVPAGGACTPAGPRLCRRLHGDKEDRGHGRGPLCQHRPAQLRRPGPADGQHPPLRQHPELPHSRVHSPISMCRGGTH